MRALSPLTGLPGNIRIQEEIRRLVGEDPQSFGVLYLDLDNFKAYNDHYGFVRGDRAIQATARLIARGGPRAGVADARSSATSGGDDFVIIVSPDEAEAVAVELCKRFDEEVPRSVRRDRPGARGGGDRGPARGPSSGTRSCPSRSAGSPPSAGLFAHFGEVVEMASEMKLVAKRTPGSSYAFDRRAT